MHHSIVCKECQAKLKLKEGKTVFRGSCPRCNGPIVWSAPEDGQSTVKAGTAVESETVATSKSSASGKSSPSEAAASSEKEFLRQVLAGFDNQLPRRSPSLSYRLALLGTAIAIVFLMTIYLAIILGTAYGVYWYGINILPSGFQFSGRISVLAIAFHGSVLFAGAAILFSLVVPLFSSRGHESAGRLVTLRDAPLLHAFVGKIADSLGAPIPAEIRLIYAVNASASYGGLSDIFRKRLVLAIGSPLVAGMNTQQLAGVIAHELGHFGQRGGMLLRHFVFTFAIWCGTASGVQEAFAEGVKEGNDGESLPEIIFRFIIWATQSIGSLIVLGMAYVGLFLTMLVSRRQEFDADRYEAEMAGSDAFFGTTRRLIELSIGQSEIRKRGLSYFLALANQSDGMENFAAEVVAAADAKAESSVKKIEKDLQTVTGWFDSHPGSKDRIAAVRLQPKPGIFRLMLPAWKLYPKFNPNQS